MLIEMVIAGSGGQGIQFAGQILGRAAVRQGLQATYVPAYGAERRGGTSFCSAVISDGPIYSPVASRLDVLLAFDQRGRNMYAGQVKPDGLILANQDLALRPAANESCRVLLIPATTLAESIGSEGALNLVMLGAWVVLGKIVDLENVLAEVKEKSVKKPELLQQNLQALEQGAAWAREQS